jgi:hypothetical protein
MRTFLLLCTLACLSSSLVSQDIRSITTGGGYRKQSFFRLSDGIETIVDDTKWDLAFTVYGQQDAGVHINESAGSSMGQPLAGLVLLDAKTTDFSAVPDPALLTDQLLNPEASWGYGAFNAGRVVTNPFDFGWGTYNPGSNGVAGGKVFVLKLRNGQYKKLQLQSLSGTVYSFRYADLNGGNEKSATIDKSQFAGKTLAYFSISTNQIVDVEPATGFDLMYCRYITTLYDPATMTDITYQLTGILQGRGVQVAKATGVVQTAVDYASWDDSLKTRLDVIGHDWKTFTGAGWEVPTDVVYYIRTASNRVYHLYFIDFEGSATGTAVYEIRDLGTLSSVNQGLAPVSSFDVYPNPAKHQAQLVFTTDRNQDVQLVITDMAGRQVQSRSITTSTGFQTEALDVSHLQSGIYQVQLRGTEGAVSQKLVVTH